MLTERRPLIATRPIERMGDATAVALEQGEGVCGILGHGDARVGKTKAATILCRTTKWCRWPLFCYQMNYSKPPKEGSEGYFFNVGLNASNQQTLNHAFGTNVLTRFKNLLVRGAHQANATIILLAINESNRFRQEEFEHLVSLQNDVELAGKRLFVMLMSQNDADPSGPQGIYKDLPRQITARFLDTKHHYTGLLWDKPLVERDNGLENDIYLALMQYDIGVLFGDNVPCSRWFAPRASDLGWTLRSQLNDFRTEITELRTAEGLPELGPWPMQTFEPFVYYLLVRIAGSDPGFRGFTKPQIQEALKFSNYLSWELNRVPVQKK